MATLLVLHGPNLNLLALASPAFMALPPWRRSIRISSNAPALPATICCTCRATPNMS